MLLILFNLQTSWESIVNWPNAIHILLTGHIYVDTIKIHALLFYVLKSLLVQIPEELKLAFSFSVKRSSREKSEVLVKYRTGYDGAKKFILTIADLQKRTRNEDGIGWEIRLEVHINM